MSEPFGCGRCCTRIGCPPFTVEEAQTLPRELQAEFGRYGSWTSIGLVPHKEYDGEPCRWLDLHTMLCTHYDLRPRVCQRRDCRNEEECLVVQRMKRSAAKPGQVARFVDLTPRITDELLDAGCQLLYADKKLGQLCQLPPEEQARLKKRWRRQVEEFYRRIDGVREPTNTE